MRLKLLILFLSLLAATMVSATAQSPDRLIYDGQSYSLLTNPLETYFSDNPDQHPRKAEDGNSVTLSTGLWRGYIATFEVIDKTLVLTNFEVRRSSPNRDERSKLVSEIERFFGTPESRRMEWYSGIMVLPTGEMKQYVHLSYASVF